MNNTKIVPQEIQNLFSRYLAIPVPYFQTKRIKDLREHISKGKGTIDAITAHLKNNNITKDQYSYLQSQGIGIDCSGFITWMYDTYTMAHLQKHIWTLYKRTTLNPIKALLFKTRPLDSKMNANTLTSKENTVVIPHVQDALPMDLIRMSGGKHVAMIYATYYEDGIIKKITYIHSTENVGVMMGTIMVTDPQKPITAQTWEKNDKNPKYDPYFLIRYRINDNGIRRPYFLYNHDV